MIRNLHKELHGSVLFCQVPPVWVMWDEILFLGKAVGGIQAFAFI